MLIGVVGDYKPGNETHEALQASLGHAGAQWEWVPTEEVRSFDRLSNRYAGLWIAPASPYNSMEGALRAITFARHRGVPLVGT